MKRRVIGGASNQYKDRDGSGGAARIKDLRCLRRSAQLCRRCILRSERNSGNYSGDGTNLVGGAADQCILGFVMFRREMLVVTLGMKLTWLMMMKVLWRPEHGRRQEAATSYQRAPGSS